MNNPYRTMADLLDDADINILDECIPTDDEYKMRVEEAWELARMQSTEPTIADLLDDLSQTWDS
jgi:hypothetical protein